MVKVVSPREEMVRMLRPFANTRLDVKLYERITEAIHAKRKKNGGYERSKYIIYVRVCAVHGFT